MRVDGLLVAGHEDVYRPSDDTLLLAEAVAREVRPGMRFLEVGTGAGLVAMAAARKGAHVVATDISAVAARLAASNARANGLTVDVLRCDLLGALAGRFDVVAFNPPYLPTAPEDVVPGPLNLAFDGGADGNATVLRFAAQLARDPGLAGVVLVVHSSLSDPAPLDAGMAKAGFQSGIGATRRLPYETLTLRRYCRLGTT